MSVEKTIHVDGKRRNALPGTTRDILGPADATPFAVVAEGAAEDADAALGAARAAFDSGPWPRTLAAERARLLLRGEALLRREREEMGLLESRDTRKTLEEGRVTAHGPVGVCALITPWNRPPLQTRWKTARRSPRATPS